jgi:hypothetical protein
MQSSRGSSCRRARGNQRRESAGSFAGIDALVRFVPRSAHDEHRCSRSARRSRLGIKRWEAEITRSYAQQEAAHRGQAAGARRKRRRSPAARRAPMDFARNHIGSPGNGSSRVCCPGSSARTACSSKLQRRPRQRTSSPSTDGRNSAPLACRSSAAPVRPRQHAPPATANRWRTEASAAPESPSLRVCYA